VIFVVANTDLLHSIEELIKFYCLK